MRIIVTPTEKQAIGNLCAQLGIQLNELNWDKNAQGNLYYIDLEKKNLIQEAEASTKILKKTLIPKVCTSVIRDAFNTLIKLSRIK